jgi:hypothetical protein
LVDVERHRQRDGTTSGGRKDNSHHGVVGKKDWAGKLSNFIIMIKLTIVFNIVFRFVFLIFKSFPEDQFLYWLDKNKNSRIVRHALGSVNKVE